MGRDRLELITLTIQIAFLMKLGTCLKIREGTVLHTSTVVPKQLINCACSFFTACSVQNSCDTVTRILSIVSLLHFHYLHIPNASFHVAQTSLGYFIFITNQALKIEVLLLYNVWQRSTC